MTITYGFYNSSNGDRVYNAAQVSALFDSLLVDGVLGHVGEAFHVSTPGDDMEVTVDTGRAWFNSTWTDNDAVLTLAIDDAHVTLPRIDVVAIDIDTDDQVRANDILIVKGTPASSPVAPTLANTSTHHQYPLAHVRVNAGVTVILVSNITNKIGTGSCPLVTGILETMTIESIVARWEAEFEFWFDNLQDQLDENQAANLQNQITDANNTLIEEIISTAEEDEFTFDNIPGGFNMLRLVGILKGTWTSTYRSLEHMVRINDDDAANYAYLDQTDGTWVGWGSRTSLKTVQVVNNMSQDTGMVTFFQIDFPFYARSDILKWANHKGVFSLNTDAWQTVETGEQTYKNIWRSTDAITKITIDGAFLATVSRMRLYGCPF